VTEAQQPIGRGIGPALEARDVMQVLANDPLQPRDLREKALLLSGRILEFDPDVRGGQGYALARDILESGRALDKMNAIIDLQGRRHESPEIGALHKAVIAPHSGTVTAIDNLQIARIARLAGAPMDSGAGVDLLKKIGDRVEAEEPLYLIHAHFDADFNFAQDAAAASSGYALSKE
jgi:thymidine phosphorylase